MTRAEEVAIELDRIGRSGAIKESRRDEHFVLEAASLLRSMADELRAARSALSKAGAA